ncbi:MAG: GGDEF domain-containing protein [bacterium]
MNGSERKIKQLLQVLLKLDAVGPEQRRLARRVLATTDSRRLLTITRSVASDLIRRGELIRVTVNRPTRPRDDTLFLIRSNTHLVDLAPLSATSHVPTRPTSPPPEPKPKPAPPPTPQQSTPAPSTGRTSQPEFDHLLTAMEAAQDLRINDPRSGEREVILGGILELLRRIRSDLHIYLRLEEADPSWIEEQADPAILVKRSGQTGAGWETAREKGAAIWIQQRAKLPSDIHEVLTRTSANEVAADQTFNFHGAIAMPLFEPFVSEQGANGLGPEVGLLFVVPRSPLPRLDLFRLARQLSRFVSRRWRSIREMNLRIHTDSLTGLQNRAFFDNQFVLELERAKRSNSPLTLVMADLDYFKQVNDTHGHQFGDAVLQMVAQELQQVLRRIDHVCRIGGEEFALILPETSAEAAREVMSRLLTSMSRQSIQLPDSEGRLQVTLSFGVVTYPECGTDPSELNSKADQMLYRSKHNGRNQCTFYDPAENHQSIFPEPEND